MSERLELPRGERVGQRELERHDAAGVRRERGQEERRLGEVLARGRRSSGAARGFRRWHAPIARLAFLVLPLPQDAVGRHAVGHHRLCRRGRHRHGHRHAAVPPASEGAHPTGLRSEWLAEVPVGHVDRLIPRLELPEDLIEQLPRVRERHHALVRFTAQQSLQSTRPVVRGQGIERLVVERGHHLGHGRGRRPSERVGSGHDLCPPHLLLARLHPPREPFPFDREALVRPRHVDRERLGLKPALVHEPGPHGEPAAVVVAHLHAHRPLRSARLRPEPRERLPRPRHLDERPAPVVARAYERLELAPRLGDEFFRYEHERAFHGIAGAGQIEHLDRVPCLHGRRIAGRRHDELGSIDAWWQ